MHWGASCIRAHLLGGPGSEKCKEIPLEAATVLAQQQAANCVSNLRLIKQVESLEYEEFPEWDSDDD